MKKETQALSVIISKELYIGLKEFSNTNEFSMNQTVSWAIKQYIGSQPILGTIEHPSIPLVIQQPIITKTETIQEDIFKEHTLAELIIINYKSLFITTQIIKIKEHLSKLTDEQLSLLSQKLNDFKFDNKENPQKIVNFYSWSDNILNTPQIITKEATEFFNNNKAFFLEQYRQETCEEFDKLSTDEQEIMKEEFEKGTKNEFLIEKGATKKIDFKYEWLPSIKELFNTTKNTPTTND